MTSLLGMDWTARRCVGCLMLLAVTLTVTMTTLQPAMMTSTRLGVVQRTSVFAPVNSLQRLAPLPAQRLAVFFLPLDSDHDADQLATFIRDVTAVDCRTLLNISEYIVHVFTSSESVREQLEARVAGWFDMACPPGELTSHRRHAPFFHLYTAQQLVRHLVDVTADAYIDDVDYFRFVFVRRNATISGWRSTAAMLDDLDAWRPGVVMETLDNMTSLLLSATHFEVFGTLFPISASGLSDALEFLLSVYTHSNSILVVGTGNDVTELRQAYNRTESKYREILEEHKQTLDRYLSARRLSKCWRCLPSSTSSSSSRSRIPDTRVISMSLYGSSPRYLLGAVRNAQLFPVNYPGWRLWIYVEQNSTAPSKYGRVSDRILRKVVQLGAELRPADPGLAPMLWRFMVAVDPQVDIFIVRDCDSRLTPRDSAVVADWLQHESAAFHCIRDHPSHSAYSVSGGLWGGRTALLAGIFAGGLFADSMRRYSDGYIEDMNFLGRDVWPRVQSVAYCHDSFTCDKFPASHAFPVARRGSEHLGEVYDKYSVGRPVDISILQAAPVNRQCVPAS